MSLLLRPALASTAAQQQTGLASFSPAQLTVTSLNCTYHRDNVSIAPLSLSTPHPTTLPVHLQLSIHRFLCIAHVPLEPPLTSVPSMLRAQSSTASSPIAVPILSTAVSAPLLPSSLPVVSPTSASLPTLAFHLMEFPSVTCQLDLDLCGLSTATSNGVQRAISEGDMDSVFTVQLQDVHLRAHPVISAWANLWLPLLPPTLTAATAAASPKPDPASPSFFHSPLSLPASAVRLSFFVDHFSCSLHHVDRTPLVQLRLASLQLSGASSQPRSGYEGELQLSSLGLYVYDAVRGGGVVHHFDEREQADLYHRGRDCVLGMSKLSLPVTITNVLALPSRSSSSSMSSSTAATTHLLATVPIELSSLSVRYSSALLCHLPLLYSHFLSSHSRLHTAFLQRIQTRVLHSRLPRSLSFSSLPAASSTSTIPFILALDLKVDSVHVMLPVDTEDGFHALSLHVQAIRLRHELDTAMWKLPFYRSQPGFLRFQSTSLLLHHPYDRDDSPLTRQHNTPLLVSHGAVHEVLSIGLTELQLSRRSEQLMMDTVHVRLGSLGLAWSLWLQMTAFQLTRRLRDDWNDTKLFIAREHIGTRSGRERMGVEGVVGASVHARPFAVVVVVDALALELKFTEWKKAEDESKDSNRSDTHQATSSTMTFYTRQLRFSHPAGYSLPIHSSLTSWQCPHSLPITLSPGWWAINGVPILHWQQARLGGGRGSHRLPDVCCELRQGLFRLPFGFQFGRDVQLMIDRWKAFKGWRKAKRAQRQARGRPVESEQMAHRADSPYYPHAVDFDIGSLWLRLLDCSFQLCDDPSAVELMEERQKGLSEWQAEREAELAGMVDWRADEWKRGAQPTGSGGGRERSVSVSAAVWNSGTRRRRPSISGLSRAEEKASVRDGLTKSRSLNFDNFRRSGSPAPSNDSRSSPPPSIVPVLLVQAILERAFGSSNLPFPPPSAVPFTAPLLAINSPDVTFTVLSTTALQDISQLYRRTRALDPCDSPPYAAFIAAEDAARANNAHARPSDAALEKHNSFLELWGREVMLQGQRVELAWRDYPLPVITAKKLTLGGTLIIGQLQAPERWVFQQTTVLAPAALLPSSSESSTLCPVPSPLVISIARGASIPAKLYYDMQWSGVEMDVTHGMCYSPAYSALAEAFNRLTPPATPRVGGPLAWWDDMRYKMQGRLRITAVDNIAIRIMKSDSPYRRNFLQMTATNVELVHVLSAFDGWAEDLLWTVLCDEHEGAYDGTTRGPDYVQGQLLAVPNARVRVELEWTCKPRADGVACHMWDHHLHHYDWNNPHTDVMLYYRARGLRYRVEVTVQPKKEPQQQGYNSRAHPLSYYTSQLSAIPVSPDPLSPSPSPNHRHRGLDSATSPTSANHAAPPTVPGPSSLLLARPLPPAPVPVLTLRWSAYTFFWHLIAMFQEPPLFLAPLSRRTTPSLGDLFSSLSLSVHCTSPRVELLHEDERVPGRINVLLLSAENFGVDWTWVAHYDGGVKRYESQDMACDALHMHGRALVPEHTQDDEDAMQREEEKAKWKARTRTKAQLAEAKTRMRLKAYLHQQRQREEDELVNFNDEHGNYCSPFDRQPLGYHAEYFMATRTFAYRTHYQGPSVTSPLSASTAPPPRRGAATTGNASSPLPPSSSFGSSTSSERPPFDMPMQGGWHGDEWQEWFGELMADKDTPDAMDAIWEGKPYTDELSHLSHASEPSASAQTTEETFPFASVNPADDDEDELFLRRHTLSLSGDGSEEGDRKMVEDAATARLLMLMDERYARRGGVKKTHPRYHSDGSISYRQHLNGDPALMVTGTSLFSALHLPNVLPPLPPAPFGQPSFHHIGVGATRGRAPPSLQPRDVSGCSHRLLTINLKLLWSNHIKHSVTQWFDVFTQPYEPPPFVSAAREATTEWRNKGGNDRERGGSQSATRHSTSDQVREEKQESKVSVEAEQLVAAEDVEDEKALALSDGLELDQSFSTARVSTRIDSSRASPLPARSLSAPPSPGSPESEVRQSALDMLALLREAEAAPFEPSDGALLPSGAEPKYAPSRKSSIPDNELPTAAAEEPLSGSGAFQPAWLRSLLRQWKDRRDDDSAWMSLFGFDLLRPQITFQSRDTNSRLVLAAASARIDSEGLPIHVQRREKDAETELVPCGQHQLESFVYFEKKHVATLSDAQAFVCPVDVEGDERVQWVKDGMVRPEEDTAADDRGMEPTKLGIDYSAPTPSSAARKRGFSGFWNSDAGKEGADEMAAAVLAHRELTGSGVLRKIVEPCTMHFAMTQQCNIADELNARQLFVCDDANGIVMPLADQPMVKQSSVHTSTASAQGSADADDKERPLRQSIKLFLPGFSAHLDSNEYFTLLGVVQALFLFSPSAPTPPAPPSQTARASTPPPLSKDDFQALMESALEADHAVRFTQSGSHRTRAQQVRRVVQLFLGVSMWQLSQHSSPFIAAHVNGLLANHTFYDDGSSDNEISIDFLTLQSKLLAPSDPLANLLIPDPDRWMQRDVKRDKMVSVRAKQHSPLKSQDERLIGMTVYEHFEVTVFPLVLRFPHDHYLAIRRYFFPDSLHDMSEEEKNKASENFFQLPRNWKGKKAKPAAEPSVARSHPIVPFQLPRRGSMSARESPLPSPQSSAAFNPFIVAPPTTRPGGGSGSTHSSPLSSPLHSAALPPFSPPRNMHAGNYSPGTSSRASSGSASNLLNTGSSTASAPADLAPTGRPRLDSRALGLESVTVRSQVSTASLPGPIISKPTKPASPTARRQRKSLVRANADAAAAARSTRYFRYVRINQLAFLASYHGETALTSLENVRISIAPFIRNKRCWTWRQLVTKVEKHTLLRIVSQADHIIARKMGRKVDDGSGVQSLSQKFMELFTQREEEMDERKLLGFPTKASSQPAAGVAAGQAVLGADESKSNESAAGRFFRMPSMSAVHMPQLSLGSMGEELAAKAVLLFGSKKEKQKLEKEEKQKEKERKRLLKEQQQQAQKQQQQFQLQQQVIVPHPQYSSSAPITPPTTPSVVVMPTSQKMPPPPPRPPLPSRPSLSSIQPLLPSPATPAAVTTALPSPSHAYAHPSGVPTHSGLRIDPTAPPSTVPGFVSPPRAPPDLGMLSLLKKRSRPLPTAPANHSSAANITSPQAQLAGVNGSGVLLPPSHSLSLTTHHHAYVNGPLTVPAEHHAAPRAFFPNVPPLPSSSSPSSTSPHATVTASATSSPASPTNGPRRPPRPPADHPALVAVTTAVGVLRDLPARPSLPSLVRTQLAAHARSKSDISELIFMHAAFLQEQQQQQPEQERA